MIIEPASDRQYDEPGEESRIRDYQLPDKSWVSLEVETDSLYTEWSYFWLTFSAATEFSPGGVRPAWYRVFPVGSKPPQWKPLKPAKSVLKRTGVSDDDDEDPEETAREREGKFGAAKKLPVGRYVLEAKIRFGPEDVELRGIEFNIKPGVIRAGWG